MKILKNIIIVLVAMVICNQNIYSQSTWYWQNPLPQGNYLTSISFVNPDTGWAVGDAGTIIKTTNGGINLDSSD